MKINPINLFSFGNKRRERMENELPMADKVANMRANGYGNYETDCFDAQGRFPEGGLDDDCFGYTDDEVLTPEDLAEIAMYQGRLNTKGSKWVRR